MFASFFVVGEGQQFSGLGRGGGQVFLQWGRVDGGVFTNEKEHLRPERGALHEQKTRSAAAMEEEEGLPLSVSHTLAEPPSTGLVGRCEKHMSVCVFTANAKAQPQAL